MVSIVASPRTAFHPPTTPFQEVVQKNSKSFLTLAILKYNWNIDSCSSLGAMKGNYFFKPKNETKPKRKI
jgi:hypothetical protein